MVHQTMPFSITLNNCVHPLRYFDCDILTIWLVMLISCCCARLIYSPILKFVLCQNWTHPIVLDIWYFMVTTLPLDLSKYDQLFSCGTFYTWALANCVKCKMYQPGLQILCDLDLWPPDNQIWSFHALAFWTTCVNWHQQRFIRFYRATLCIARTML